MQVRILIVFLMVLICEVNGQSYPYTLQVDAGVLLGEGVRPVPALHVFNGVRIDSKEIEAGLTVGVDIYSQLNILPVTASLKWIPFPQKKLKPYLGVNIGYGLAWLNNGSAEKDYHGGFIFNPSMGFRIKSGIKSRVNIGLGFNHQRAGIVYKSFDDLGRTITETNEEYKFGRASLNFGIGF